MHLPFSNFSSSIFIWDTSKTKKYVLRQQFAKTHTKPIRNTIWSNYASEIASVSYDGSSIVWDTETGIIEFLIKIHLILKFFLTLKGQEINKFQSEQLLTAITTCPSNENIYLVGSKNVVYAWDYRINKICKKYQSLMGQVNWHLGLNSFGLN